ncbi:MAG: hypothetical protein OWQ57_13310 [Sulfobacillus sp.]|nr:hypothetical protein [Sulfobacillus sp.]
MMSTRAFRRIVVEVEPALEERLREYAQGKAMSRKAIIVQALEEFFARHGQKEGAS